jgi:hypothetical protein
VWVNPDLPPPKADKLPPKPSNWVNPDTAP